MGTPTLRKVRRTSLVASVFEQLAARILDERLGPGTPLPTERQLAETLGVNRGAVREAMSRLAQAGLVEIRQGDGTKVADYTRRGGLGLLGRMLFRADGQVNLHAARSVVEMRSAIAPDAARWCALRRSDEVLARLESAMASIVDAPDRDERQRLAIELWDAVVEGSDNIAYRLAYNTLRDTYEQLRQSLVVALAGELDAIDEMQAMVDAIREQDPEKASIAARSLIERGTSGLAQILAALEA